MGESATWLKTSRTPQDTCAGKKTYLFTLAEPPGSGNAFSLKEHLKNLFSCTCGIRYFFIFKDMDVKGT